jgi:hypothetical protein
MNSVLLRVIWFVAMCQRCEICNAQLNGQRRVGVGLISQLRIRGWTVLVVPSFSSSFQLVVGCAVLFCLVTDFVSVLVLLVVVVVILKLFVLWLALASLS